MSINTALIVIPPVFFPAWIILWHFILMLRRTGENKPNTISAHAEEKARILLVHRLSHGLPSVAILPFVFGFLLPNGYHVAAYVLITASIFDLIEVLTLRKTPVTNITAGSDGLVHKVSAWLMAMSYLLYTVLISGESGIGRWLYLIVLLLSAAIIGAFFAIGASTKRHFYILQMTFFTLTTFVMLLSHISILSRAYL